MRILFVILVLASAVTAQSVNRTFYRDTCIRRYDYTGAVVETYVRRSRFTYNDQGKLIETVFFKQGRIKGLSDDEIRHFGNGKNLRQYQGIELVSSSSRRWEFDTDVEVKFEFDDNFPRTTLTTERTLRCLGK